MELLAALSSSPRPVGLAPPISYGGPRVWRSRLGCRCSGSDVKLVASSTVAQTVRQFYTAINDRQLQQAADLIAEECVYEDLVFSKPFVGRKAVVDFFKKFTDSVSPELKFVIDEISDGDSSVGVTWHLDWRGNPFPFSKGCSFYRCKDFSGALRITYARDCVEPAFKVDMFALVNSCYTIRFLQPENVVQKAIGAVTWLFERFPGLARL